MHAITPDGKTILLADACGLTRLTLPNKVKTERKAMGSDESHLTLDAAGARAVVHDDLWDQVHVVNVPDLTRVVSIGRFGLRGAHLMPDGRSLVRFESDTLELHDLGTRESRHTKLPSDPHAAPTLALGPEGVRRAMLRHLLAVGDDGTVAILRGEYERAHVVVGTVDADAVFKPTLERTVAVHGGGPLRMRAGAGGVTLVAVSPSVGRAYVLRLARDGSATTTELPAIAVPTQDGDTWVTQRSPSELCRCDAHGAITERWTLSDAAHHGPGEVMAHGGRVWFVPHHRACVVALPSNEVISRKLTAKEEPLRRYYAPMLARYNRAGRRFDRVFTLGRTSFWDSGRAVSASYTMSAGDGSLGANLIASALWGELADGDEAPLAPFRRGGTGAGYFVTALLTPITVEAVRRAFEACDDAGVWLPFGLGWVAEYYERSVTGSSRASGEQSPPAEATLGECVLFRGVLAHLGDVSAPPLASKVDGWCAPLGADEAIAGLSRLDDATPRMPYRAFEGVAWMVARLLSLRDAARVLVWMALDGSAKQHVNSSHAIARALGAVMAREPALREAVCAAVEAHAPAPSNYGGDRREALLAVLRASVA